MAAPNRFAAQDDEDEDAFHSADEGENESDEDQGAGEVKPPQQLDDGTKPREPAALQLDERPAQNVSDGWDMDNWEEDNEDIGTNEIMVTPCMERPPPVPQLRSNSPHEPMVDNPVRSNSPQQEEPVVQKPASIWGGWGHQLLSLATDSISTLTNTVGEGFTSVLETVETTLGAPTPEELALLSVQEREALKKKADEVKEPAPVGERDDCDSASEEVSSEGGSDAGTARSDKEEQLSSGYQSDGASYQRNDDLDHEKRDHGLSSLITGVSHLFENTGRTIVSGSLDVLETLGKKTFESVTVSEPDSGNQRRRLKIPIPTSAHRTDKITLSQVLRELKENAEAEAKRKQQEQDARRYNSAALFEDAQGLAHLEALELLSSTCCQQTRSLMELLTTDQMEEVATSMESLKLLFESTDGKNVIDEEPMEQDLAALLKQNLKFTSFSPSRLLSLDEEARSWINGVIREQDNGTRVDANEIYARCLGTLAIFTAAGVEMYHKLGQLLLVPSASTFSTQKGADNVAAKSLISITHLLAEELSFLCSRYTTSLNTASDDSEDPDAVSRMLTNVFYEASNSVSYVQEAFKLLLPVVQLASVRERLR